MATHICPVIPPSIWFPVDPGVVELPTAPTVTTNPSPEPANTAPGTYTPEDFSLEGDDYGYVKGQTCYTFDYGYITDAVTVSSDYGSLLTIWDTLPTDSPAVPAEEVDTTNVYPPYREIVVQTFNVFAVAEVIPVQKTTVDLDVLFVTKTNYTATKVVKVVDITAITFTRNDVVQVGGNVLVSIKTKLILTPGTFYSSLGMLCGFEVT